jgi:quercetin dioxygenase-like cupin family protein
MTIIVNHGYGAAEEQALGELSRDGFSGAARDYAPGRTEPHQHDYDVCLYVLDGEFRLLEADTGVVHSCGPGAKVFVTSGTLHSEDHGALRMVVGRRQQG